MKDDIFCICRHGVPLEPSVREVVCIAAQGMMQARAIMVELEGKDPRFPYSAEIETDYKQGRFGEERGYIFRARVGHFEGAITEILFLLEPDTGWAEKDANEWETTDDGTEDGTGDDADDGALSDEEALFQEQDSESPRWELPDDGAP